MTLLIIRSFLLFLAIAVTGIALTIIAGWCAMVSTFDPSKNADFLGRFRVNFPCPWIWLVVGLLWATFFFLGLGAL